MLMVAADETRKAGLRLLVHALEPARAREAVEADPAVLVHDVFTGPIDRELLEAIKRSGTIVIPTLSVMDGYADVYLGRSPARRYPLDCVDSATRRKLETVVPDTFLKEGRRAFWEGPKGKALRSTASANLKRMYQAGIPLAMGTDAGNPGTAHGPSVYNEMEAMQQAMGIMLPSVLLSGYIIPLGSLPLPLRVISQLLPATHFIKIARGIIIRGATFGDLWQPVFALLAISAILIAASARAFRKTVS